MPRNGAGVYSLPAGTDDFQPNTVIESSVMDSLTADLKAALNTAWPVSLGGTGGTSTAAWTVPHGTASLPGLAFIGDTNTGLYWIASDNIGVAANGNKVLDIGVGGLAVAGALTPITSDGGALGSASLMWSDLFFAAGAVVNFNNGDVTLTHSSNLLAFGGASSGYTFDAVVKPSANDAAALGVSGTAWSDLFLASGAVINFVAGDVTITHSSNLLAFGGASSGYTFDAVIKPSANDAAALGVSGTAWSDAFFASGAVIDFNAGDVTITHSANLLAFGGASSGYTFDAVVKASSNDGAALGASGTGWSDLFLAAGAVINFNAGNATITHSTGTIAFSAPSSFSFDAPLFLSLGSNAGQIFFPGTDNPSVDPHCLDDYEEGTTTPTVTSGTGSFTSVSCALNYTKIGNRVFGTAVATITTAGTAAGALNIPMPFTVGGASAFTGYESATGFAVAGRADASATPAIFKYDGTTIIASGRIVYVLFDYRI